MNPLLKPLRAKNYYAVGIALSAALSLIAQYPKLDALLESFFSPKIPPKAKILHQPDLVNHSKGSFLIIDPVSENNPSFEKWSVKIVCAPDGCSSKYINIYDHTDRHFSTTRNSSITSRNDTLAIHPGTFIRGNYELSHGRIEDIIFSSKGFGFSKKIQEDKIKAQKRKAFAIKAIIHLFSILILLGIIHYKNQQIDFLKIGLLNEWQEKKKLKGQIQKIKKAIQTRKFKKRTINQ